MKTVSLLLTVTILMYSCISCVKEKKKTGDIRLITVDPGHFHAALVQKTMYNQIDTNVVVYAPAGDDVLEHIKRIEAYNNRIENPTHWNEIVYQGDDFLQKMLEEKRGNVVVLAGNNQKKIDYIKASIDNGLNVLADKPMVINSAGFELLGKVFETAKQKGILVYDIMTERSEITTILQKEFSIDTLVFGMLVKGTAKEPAITKESVHHFYKYVSGSALKRPAWFFDVQQQGEGIVDVTTHLVDLIQWECFPDQIIDYHTDIDIIKAKRWTTCLSPSEFKEVTRLNNYPACLEKDLKDSILQVYANGEILYKIKDHYAKVSVIWNYRAPEEGGDTHYSVMRGTKADLIIQQGKEQQFKPTLYIQPNSEIEEEEFANALSNKVKSLQSTYPGIEVKRVLKGWEVVIPEKYKIGHEEHFAQVTERYLHYLKDGRLPEWEVPNMLAKYYTVTKALEIARQH